MQTCSCPSVCSMICVRTNIEAVIALIGYRQLGTIEQEKLTSLRYMRKVNPEAYAYVIKTDRLLAELQG